MDTANRVTISIILPVGSEEGPYEAQTRSQAESRHFLGQGEAVFEDRNVLLRVEADLRELQSGSYFLGIRKPEFRWAYYRIRTE